MTPRAAAAATLAIAMSAAAAAPDLRCTLEAPARVAAGAPVMLRFTLTNAGGAALDVLRWNTPFEGAWFAPFVAVTRDGRALAYGGPMKKRGEPTPAQYLHLEPGASEHAEIDLALPFDLAVPGRYHVAPRIRLVDVVDATQAQPPRPRASHQNVALACPAVDVVVTPR